MASTRDSGYWLGAAADRLEFHRRKAFLLVEGGRDFLDRVHKEDEGAECHDSMEGEQINGPRTGAPVVSARTPLSLMNLLSLFSPDLNCAFFSSYAALASLAFCSTSPIAQG